MTDKTQKKNANHSTTFLRLPDAFDWFFIKTRSKGIETIQNLN